MSDLFLMTDDRLLLSKWDYGFSLLEIVARDYRSVLRGERYARRHRTILVQTVSDLLDVETDLTRLGATPPSARLTGPARELWQAATELVCELRQWRVPPVAVSADSVEAADRTRRVLEGRMNDVILDLPDAAEEADADTIVTAPVIVTSTCP